jgi:hypothetical protein
MMKNLHTDKQQRTYIIKLAIPNIFKTPIRVVTILNTGQYPVASVLYINWIIQVKKLEKLPGISTFKGLAQNILTNCNKINLDIIVYIIDQIITSYT